MARNFCDSNFGSEKELASSFSKIIGITWSLTRGIELFNDSSRRLLNLDILRSSTRAKYVVYLKRILNVVVVGLSLRNYACGIALIFIQKQS